MSRHNRPYLPGGVFHLTARTLDQQKWFSDPAIRDEIAHFISIALVKTDAQLLAFAIMFNHLHLLVRQRLAPLSQLMHPLLRRTAIRLNRVIGREGYVFERRYGDSECKSADHVRNAILYIHRNAPKAGICPTAADYDWSSHGVYCGGDSGEPQRVCRNAPTVNPVLNLFASAPGRTPSQLHDDYREYFDAWDLLIRFKNGDPIVKLPPILPSTDEGDRYWTREFAGSLRSTIVRGSAPSDLTDFARGVLAAHLPDVTLEDLQSRRGGPAFVAARHEIIKRASLVKYRGVQISKVLKCSEATVSRVAATVSKRPSVFHGYKSTNA
jgi:REP element-mobilizing transposase RayT